MRRPRSYWMTQLRMVLLGTVPLLIVAAMLGLAPTASARPTSWSWGWQYASWGQATGSVTDTFRSFSGYTKDVKEDGYCVKMAEAIRNANDEVWGSSWVPGSTNCAKNVQMRYSGSADDIDSRFPYVCDLTLVRGTSYFNNAGYLTVWREAGFEPDECGW